jgi:hypothetical protein
MPTYPGGNGRGRTQFDVTAWNSSCGPNGIRHPRKPVGGWFIVKQLETFGNPLWQRLLGAASVRVWHITSRRWGPWTERPLPEVVRAAYPPDAVHNHSFLSRHLLPLKAQPFAGLLSDVSDADIIRAAALKVTAETSEA